MDNRQKHIIIGGILVIGGLVGCYTLYRKKKENKAINYAPIPRDQVLTVLANIAFQNECLIKSKNTVLKSSNKVNRTSKLTRFDQ